MGQVLRRTDSIGALTGGGATIQIGPSVITVGAQQFSMATTSLNIGSPPANTRFMLYFTWDGVSASPTLVQSSNVNSVGPAGALYWKLVGAYYSNGLPSPTFGSFVNITGAPRSGIIQAGKNVFTASTSGSFVKGNGGVPSIDSLQWHLDGGTHIFVQMTYGHTVAGSSGVGNLKFGMPVNVSVDPSFMGVYTGTDFNTSQQFNFGRSVATTGATNGSHGGIFMFDSTNFCITLNSPGDQGIVGNAFLGLANTATTFGAEFKIALLNGVQTQLLDL